MSGASRSDAGRRHERDVIDLHEAMRVHGSDSSEADAIRERMEADWYAASPDEQAILRGLSADLYQISNEEILNPNPQAVGPDHLLQALRSQDGPRVLELLRERSVRGELDGDKAILMRARAYEWAGYDRAALAFYEHHHGRTGDEGSFGMALLVLVRVDSQRARGLVEAIEGAADVSPERLGVATNALAQLGSPPGQARSEHDERVAQLGRRAHLAYLKKPASASPVSNALGIRAMALSRLGRLEESLEALELAAGVHRSGPVLFGRGYAKLRLGRPDAYVDLVDAFCEGAHPPDASWYEVAAYYAYQQGDMPRCRSAAALGLGAADSDMVRGALHHFIALSSARLGRPPNEVLASFDAARRLLPLEDGVERNLQSYLASVRGQPLQFEPASAPDEPTESPPMLSNAA